MPLPESPGLIHIQVDFHLPFIITISTGPRGKVIASLLAIDSVYFVSGLPPPPNFVTPDRTRVPLSFSSVLGRRAPVTKFHKG